MRQLKKLYALLWAESVCCVVSSVWRAGVRFNRAGLWWGNLQIMVTAGGWETVGLSQGQSCLAQVGELGKVPNTN